MADGENDELLRELLGQLTGLVSKAASAGSGPKTEEVRSFIRQHRKVKGFKDLAFTLLLMSEGEK